MHTKGGLVIFGFGGHGRSVAAVALANGIKSLLFVDENARENEKFLGFPVIRHFDIPKGWSCMPAVGDNERRQKQFELARSAGWPLAKIIAKNATIDVDAKLSPGCFIGHHAHIGPSAQLGRGCIVNTGAIVEHEASVGDFSHVSVNAVLAGRSQVGSFVFVGTGAVIIDSVSVGDRITIGAGATVVHSLNIPGVYVGSPAKRLTAEPTEEVCSHTSQSIEAVDQVADAKLRQSGQHHKKAPRPT
jgi:sugar O-acyltransferase (sialic acid O-acetyltransferase NeuD family)